ncbi:DNA-directed DNA polymerase alpha subunit pol12, partial [Serendipita sp. 411]
IHDSVKERQYRYMHERLTERSTVLDDRLDEFAELVRVHYNLEDIGDPASTSDEELVVVGRICCEEDSTKLNESSVMLETSRLMGAGMRVLLKFNPSVTTNGESPVLPLYPGAIVALKGINETGEWFQVSQILSIPLLPNNISCSSQERPVSMAIAAGPFTIDSNLNYAEFKHFLGQIGSNTPSWVLLLGPFVDVNHPSIKSGDVDYSPLELFRYRILEPLRTFLDEHPTTTALVIPSVRDLISHHAVFPQAPLPLTQTNRIFFYPLFPSDDVNLDVSHSELLGFQGSNPDVLIIPSMLKHFHKNVHGTVVINPGKASKSEHSILRISDPLSARGAQIVDRVEVQFSAVSSLSKAFED